MSSASNRMFGILRSVPVAVLVLLCGSHLWAGDLHIVSDSGYPTDGNGGPVHIVTGTRETAGPLSAGFHAEGSADVPDPGVEYTLSPARYRWALSPSADGIAFIVPTEPYSGTTFKAYRQQPLRKSYTLSVEMYWEKLDRLGYVVGELGNTFAYYDIDLTIIKVDLVIQSLPEEQESPPHEEDPGAYVGLNNDDDDQDGTLDSGSSESPVEGEDDLVAATISFAPGSLDFGTLTLQVNNSGDGRVALWDDASKTTSLPAPKSWDLSCYGSQPKTVWLEGTALSSAAKDIELKLGFCSSPGDLADEGTGGRYGLEDKVMVTVMVADLDIDSDNNNQAGDPDHSDAEEVLEDNPYAVGKVIAINDNDDNGNGIPDFADGFDFDTSDSADDQNVDEKFVPITITLPGSNVLADISDARLTISYSGSDPAGVQRSGSPGHYTYAPASGALRLWTKDGCVARTKRPVSDSDLESEDDDGLGFYIAPGSYDGDSLKKLGFDNCTRSQTFYVEAIEVSSAAGDQLVSIDFDPDTYGPAPSLSDTARITCIQVELVRGDVDPTTGRGDNGGAGALHPIEAGDSPLAASEPRPRIVIQSISASNVQDNANNRLTADITVSGYVTSAFADIVPDNADDPLTATITVSDRNSTTADLTRVEETATLLRPYAAHYTFTATLTGLGIESYQVPVTVEAEDPATGATGMSIARSDVEATRTPDPTPADTLLMQRGLSQPLKVRVNFGANYTVQDALNAGPEALTVDAKRSFVADETATTKGCGLTAPANANMRITNPDGQFDIEITDASAIGLSQSELGWFTAIVRAPGIYPDDVAVVFEETAGDSNVFVSRYVEAVVTFSGPLDPNAADVLSAQVRRVVWDTPGSWQSAIVYETGADTKVFNGTGIEMAVLASSEFSGSEYDEIALSVTCSSLGLSSWHVDGGEYMVDGLVFQSDAVFGYITPFTDYSEVWVDGEWQTQSPVILEPGNYGWYAPLMVRINGPVEVADTGLRVTILGGTHDIVVQDGVMYSSGSEKPGNFAMTGYLREGPMGGGHITDSGDFVWESFDGWQKGKDAAFYKTAHDLMDALQTIGHDRWIARTTGANPGQTYWGAGQQYNAANDPLNRTIDLLWESFDEAKTELRKTTVDDAVRTLALHKMTRNIVNVEIAGIPHSPNILYVEADGMDPKVKSLGSHHLIGHYLGYAGTHDDGGCQMQNITQFIHLGTGLGWGDLLEGKVTELGTILHQQLSDDERSKAIMAWLRKYDYLAALKPEKQAKIKEYGDVKAFRYGVAQDSKWLELVDIMRMAMAGGADKISALDLFMAYDIASGEGFHIFGLDSFNDVIATDAGDLIGKELSQPGCAITSKETLRQHLEADMAQARLDFLRHPRLADKDKVLQAFFKVQMSSNFIHFTPVSFGSVPVWRATLGTICEKNKARFKNAQGRIDFINTVKATVTDMTATTSTDPVKATLDSTDVDALQQIVEMLSLLGQDRN